MILVSFFIEKHTHNTHGKQTNLQKVIQVIANATFIMANVMLIGRVTETGSNRLVHKQKV